MNDFTTTTDSRLDRLYRGTSKRVAFLDETYLSKKAPGIPFHYAMTAVVISSGDLDSVRWAYANQAGNAPWHTTERFVAGLGTEITDFVDLLASEADPVVVVVQVDAALGEADVESARHTCFTKLVDILRNIHDVALVVYERRRPGREQDTDEETARQLRRRYAGLTVIDAWSGSEPLLWAPDVVAWTLQRRLVWKETWFDPLIDVAAVYRHDGVRVTNMRKISP